MNDKWAPMKLKQDTPKVGVGVLVFNEEDKILLGKRAGSHGDGYWACPGGHIDLGETIECAAIREIKEELGIECDINDIIQLSAENDIFEDEGLHYITIYVELDSIIDSDAPKIMEDSFTEIGWFDMHNLPENTWETVRKFIGTSII